VTVEMRHLRTSPLSGQASRRSPRVPDAIGLPLRGSVIRIQQAVDRKSHLVLIGSTMHG
jgi:hypothetical protein